MSSIRHDRDVLVRGYAVTHPAGRAQVVIEPGWDQILYTAGGVMTVATEHSRWSVPVGRAVCVPASVDAVMDNQRGVRVRALYFRPDPGPGQYPDMTRVRAIHLSSFGRELLDHIVAAAPLDRRDTVGRALVTVLIDQIDRPEPTGLQLPLPSGDLGKRLIDNAFHDPGVSVAQLARSASASLRTVERLIARDTGLSAGLWLRRARVLSSLEVLTETRSVTEAAHAGGYSTPSAYIVAFTRELGMTPGRYIADDGPADLTRAHARRGTHSSMIER
ncbi:AraC family transcriptional regulator [Gordonia sp. NPDC003504]